MAKAVKTENMRNISVLCSNGAVQISLKRFILPSISIGVQNRMTAGMAICILATQTGICSCLAKTKKEPIRQLRPTSNVTG